MIGSAIGPVMSFAITTSSFASISWPASTESSPAWAARIFCVIVIPMLVIVIPMLKHLLKL